MMNTHPHPTCRPKFLVALLFCVSAPAWAQHYTITKLPTLGGTNASAGSFSGQALNASGQATGTAQVAGDAATHAFRYSFGTTLDLGTLGGTNSYGFAINSSGEVAGASEVTVGSSAQHAFLYNGSAMLDLGTFGGSASYAGGINTAGDVVGAADLSGNTATHAFLYHAGSMLDLGTLGGTQSGAIAVNDSGKVAGGATTAGDNATHAFVYSAGTMTDLGALDGRDSYASAINASGEVAGFSTTATDTLWHAFIAGGTGMTDIGTLGGDFIVPTSINSSGEVAGYSDFTTDNGNTSYTRAFLYDGSHLFDLNSVLPSDAGITLTAATINDSGQILADGVDASGTESAYLLTPTTSVPDTGSTLLLLAAGLAALMFIGAPARRQIRNASAATGKHA